MCISDTQCFYAQLWVDNSCSKCYSNCVQTALCIILYTVPFLEKKDIYCIYIIHFIVVWLKIVISVFLVHMRYRSSTWEIVCYNILKKLSYRNCLLNSSKQIWKFKLPHTFNKKCNIRVFNLLLDQLKLPSNNLHTVFIITNNTIKMKEGKKEHGTLRVYWEQQEKGLRIHKKML